MLNKIKVTPSKGENPRRDLFETLLGNQTTAQLVPPETPTSELDYQLFFSQDLFLSNKSVLKTPIADTLGFKRNEEPKAVIDISNYELFDDPKLASIVSLAIVCAKGVTCSDPVLQEIIYDHTGRLAAIVENPLEKDRFKKPDLDSKRELKNPNIVWVGLLEEIFSIKQEQTLHKNMDIDTVLLDDAQKKITKKVEEADFIYLPLTHSEETEKSRALKVIYGVLEGKFVVAPNLKQNQEIAFDGDLKKALAYFRTVGVTSWIKEKQQILKQKHSEKETGRQLKEAFDKLIPNDDYHESIDYFLDVDSL